MSDDTTQSARQVPLGSIAASPSGSLHQHHRHQEFRQTGCSAFNDVDAEHTAGPRGGPLRHLTQPTPTVLAKGSCRLLSPFKWAVLPKSTSLAKILRTTADETDSGVIHAYRNHRRPRGRHADRKPRISRSASATAHTKQPAAPANSHSTTPSGRVSNTPCMKGA